jgi:hypothetical protein
LICSSGAEAKRCAPPVPETILRAIPDIDRYTVELYNIAIEAPKANQCLLPGAGESQGEC